MATRAEAADFRQQLAIRAAAVGVAIGIVYSLSPLTVWFGVAMAGLLAWSASGADEDERRWIWRLLIAAVVLKTVALSSLFLAKGVFASRQPGFFGDEEYFKKRSLLLRSIALHVPVSPEDIVDAFDEYSSTSYLYVLAYLQVLFGPSPFAVHLFNWAVSIAGAILLYKMVRPSFGLAASLVGLALTLFLPSMFIWSTSALKEPVFMTLSNLALMIGVNALRRRFSWSTLLAAAVCVGAILAAETVRARAIPFMVAGLAGAAIGRFVVPRRRVAIALVAAAIALAGATAVTPALQERPLASLRLAALSHRGYINSPGLTYRLLDEKYYGDRAAVLNMSWDEAIAFARRAVVSFIVVPLPWQIKSREAILFMPEQIAWYMLLVLAPVGVVAGLRRDPTATMALAAYSLVAGAAIALSSGNIGTLVRHRGIMLTYLVWLSALGGCEVLRAGLSRKSPVASPKSPVASLGSPVASLKM